MLYDKDIREPLFMYLEEKYAKCRIFEEKRMGRSRADVFLITDKNFVGIEIKSDADTYARLKNQVNDYDKYCDYNYVVVGSTHAAHISEHVPPYWGIISVEEIENKVDFYTIREPALNPNAQIEPKLRFLWRPELAHIQELNSMHMYKNKSKDFVTQKILSSVPEDILMTQICNELFERDYTIISDVIAKFRQEKGKKRRKASNRIKKYRIK